MCERSQSEDTLFKIKGLVEGKGAACPNSPNLENNNNDNNTNKNIFSSSITGVVIFFKHV